VGCCRRCSVSQCGAVCCSVSQSNLPYSAAAAPFLSRLPRGLLCECACCRHCSVLRCVAVCYSRICFTVQQPRPFSRSCERLLCVCVWCSVMQCDAVCCSVLQSKKPYCAAAVPFLSKLLRDLFRGCVLQCAAV